MVSMIPMTDLYMVIIPCVLIIVFLGFYLLTLKTNAPEAFIFRKARRKGFDIRVEVDISTGDGRFVLCEPEDDESSPYYKREGMGLKIRPDFSTGEVMPIRINGIRFFHWATTASNPLGFRTAQAFQTIKAHRHEKPDWKHLDNISDQDLLSLLKTPECDLLAACQRIVDIQKVEALPDLEV